MPFLTIFPKTSRSPTATKNNNCKRIPSHRDVLIYKLLTIPLRKRKLGVLVKKLFASRCIVNAFHHPRNVGRTAPAYHARIMMNFKRISMLPRLASKKEESVIAASHKKDAIVKNRIA
jgi:hypothetical protein